MKTSVMALTAVMPDGRIIKTGAKYVEVEVISSCLQSDL
jgi:hypothetical protein